MLDAQHRNLRVHRLLSLIIVLHDLREVERRDHLAAISLKIATNWDARIAADVLAEVLGDKEVVAALPEPDTAELTADRITALISDTITEIRDRKAHRAPETTDASTNAI